MPTPAEIILTVSNLMNDPAQSDYNNTTVLPFLNMALRECQEHFEANNVPVTNQVETVLSIPAGTTIIRFPTPGQAEALPVLPANLIDIQQLWESAAGTNNWWPMTRRDFLPPYIEGQSINQFLIWCWRNQEIHLPEANADNDIRMQYVASIFQTIGEPDLNANLPFLNIHSYLSYKTAALCSMFYGENETRAAALNAEAMTALDRSLGISNRQQQGIFTRHRPFRAGFKSRFRF